MNRLVVRWSRWKPCEVKDQTNAQRSVHGYARGDRDACDFYGQVEMVRRDGASSPTICSVHCSPKHVRRMRWRFPAKCRQLIEDSRLRIDDFGYSFSRFSYKAMLTIHSSSLNDEWMTKMQFQNEMNESFAINREFVRRVSILGILQWIESESEFTVEHHREFCTSYSPTSYGQNRNEEFRITVISLRLLIISMLSHLITTRVTLYVTCQVQRWCEWIVRKI